MPRRWKQLGMGLLGFALLGTGTVLAQQGGSGQLEMSSSTTPEEKAKFSQDAIAEMQRASRELSGSLESAERNQETAKVECLSKYTSAVQSLLSVTENASVAMQDALDEGDTERANHEFRKITVARAKAQELLTQAKATCLGEDVSQVIESDTGLGSPGDTERINDGTLDTEIGDEPPGTSPFE